MPVVDRRIGQVLFDATVHALQDWDVMDFIGTCWDTTASNTGVHECATTHLEDYLGKAFLWLACRHHMAELHIKHTYDRIQGATNGEQAFAK